MDTVETPVLVKTSLNLTEDSFKTLKALAKGSNVSMAEIIRRAISLEKLIYDAAQNGSRVLIKAKDDSMTEVIFR